MSGVKQCNKCHQVKPASDFAKSRAERDGLQRRCRNCSREDNRASYHRNKDKHKAYYQQNRDEIRRRQKGYRTDNIENYKAIAERYRSSVRGRAKQLYGAAMRRAERLGLEFSITLIRIECALFAGVCERTGVPFSLNNHERYQIHPFAPSLDRKDPFIGYTNDNTQIVCNAYNVGKNQMSDDEYIAFCKIVAEKCG